LTVGTGCVADISSDLFVESDVGGTIFAGGTSSESRRVASSTTLGASIAYVCGRVTKISERTVEETLGVVEEERNCEL